MASTTNGRYFIRVSDESRPVLPDELIRLVAEEGPRLRRWLGKLIDQEIVLMRGKTRGTEYRINPEILCKKRFKGPTTLKSIAPYRLKELVLADITTHAPDLETRTKFGDIHKRVGEEISDYKLRVALQTLCEEGKIKTTGKRGHGSGYCLCENLPNK